MKFGVNTFVWVSPCTTDAVKDLAPRVKSMGFDILEISVENPVLLDVKVVKVVLRDHQLEGILCGAFGPDRNICSDDPKKVANAKTYIRWLIDAAAQLDSKVVCGPMYSAVGKEHLADSESRRKEWDRAVAGIQEMADLSRGEKLALLDELDGLGTELDFMLIDTAAGIAGNVIYFNVAAREIIVVVSPEPTSITDAYALIKILYSNYGEKRFMLLVNMVRNSNEAREVFLKVSNATSHFLNLSIEYLGYVFDDAKVTEAVRRQKALAEIYPDSRASKCLQSIARKLCRLQPEFSESGSLKFFWKSIVEKERR